MLIKNIILYICINIKTNIMKNNKINIAKVKMIPINKLIRLNTNRDLVENHISTMEKLISLNGFADTIKVAPYNKNYIILEGQHRVSALKDLNIKEVPCSIIDWVKVDSKLPTQIDLTKYIIDLNVNNRPLNLYDYIQIYSKLGLSDYEYLINQINSYKKTLSTAILSQIYGRDLKSIRLGNLKIKDKLFADKICLTLDRLVRKYGRGSVQARIQRQVISKLHSSDEKKSLLVSFEKAVNYHLGMKDQFIPLAEKEFNNWWRNKVLSIQLDLKQLEII